MNRGCIVYRIESIMDRITLGKLSPEPKKQMEDPLLGAYKEAQHSTRLIDPWVFTRLQKYWYLSLTHAQSNGFSERMVQSVKNTMKKAKDSKSDIDIALLRLRTTPFDCKIPSPAWRQATEKSTKTPGKTTSWGRRVKTPSRYKDYAK